jgi:hypothetical protein
LLIGEFQLACLTIEDQESPGCDAGAFGQDTVTYLGTRRFDAQYPSLKTHHQLLRIVQLDELAGAPHSTRFWKEFIDLDMDVGRGGYG